MILHSLLCYHDQHDDGQDWNRRSDEHSASPVVGQYRDHREHQVTGEEEHVGRRHHGASEFRFAYLAEIRCERAAGESHAQPH